VLFVLDFIYPARYWKINSSENLKQFCIWLFVSGRDVPVLLQELLVLYNSVATSVKTRGSLLAEMNDEAVKYQHAVAASHEILLAAKKKLVQLENLKTETTSKMEEHHRQLEVLFLMKCGHVYNHMALVGLTEINTASLFVCYISVYTNFW
jgi:hypothetical protein